MEGSGLFGDPDPHGSFPVREWEEYARFLYKKLKLMLNEIQLRLNTFWV